MQITASVLIENVELAFAARDRFSWARRLYDKDNMSFFTRIVLYTLATQDMHFLRPWYVTRQGKRFIFTQLPQNSR